MVITIDKEAERPIYRQICDEVIRGIAAGELEAGDEMPSVRALASDLGINLHTVNKAYAVLRDEGYLRLRGRRKTVVAPRRQSSEDPAGTALPQPLAAELRRLVLAAKARGISRTAFESALADIARSVYEKGR